ncbi:MAG: TonB-dependent receptor, partial [Bacteroidetes bacterium]
MASTTHSFAQVTTSSITGIVTDDSGEVLIGATVVATHTPSGTVYGTTTRDDGRFTLPNLRVGGPYTVEASYVGFENQKFEEIQLQLAQKLNIEFVLKSTAVELGGVVITGKLDPILNSERTGAETNIDRQTIERLPTISRAARDYYRLTPSADGNSFGGRNNKMNNFTLDGSIFNNPFGLDAATPGSQSDAQPVSLDAIEQVQVNIAPYDVTQAGFTGAAVNAVTKSGTNEFTGTVFGFFRNDGMTGSKISGEDIFVPNLQHFQTGFA